MKQHIIVGLLTIFVLASVVEVFSASMGPFPEQQEELGVQQQAPSIEAEFPFAPNNTTLGLRFRVWITNRTGMPLTIQFSTTCQATISVGFNFTPFQIAALSPADIGAPPEAICQVRLSAPGTTFFGAVLEILTTEGTSVGFIEPQFFGAVGGG
jgi:hypothetical protein